MRLRISEKVVGSKLDKFGGGIIGKRKGSGESDGENLERMRSILSLKNWRNELASDCVSGVSGDELDGLRWRIEFKVFQSVRGLEDDSVTRLVRKLDLALEIRDLTKLHWALNFLRSKGDFQRRHDRSSRLLLLALAFIHLFTVNSKVHVFDAPQLVNCFKVESDAAVLLLRRV